MTKSKVKEVEEYLDERWNIYRGMGNREADLVFYNGCVQMCVTMGYLVTRFATGKHVLSKTE